MPGSGICGKPGSGIEGKSGSGPEPGFVVVFFGSIVVVFVPALVDLVDLVALWEGLRVVFVWGLVVDFGLWVDDEIA